MTGPASVCVAFLVIERYCNKKFKPRKERGLKMIRNLRKSIVLSVTAVFMTGATPALAVDSTKVAKRLNPMPAPIVQKPGHAARNYSKVRVSKDVPQIRDARKVVRPLANKPGYVTTSVRKAVPSSAEVASNNSIIGEARKSKRNSETLD